MEIASPILQPIFQNSFSLAFKIGYLFFVSVYFIFSLIVVRQVQLMGSTVKTEAGKILSALAILHSGIALGIIVLLVGFL